MSIRLEDDVREVVWTETHKATIHVGYCDCDLCGRESPPPTHDQLIAYAKAMRDGGFLWPSDDYDGCMPPDWARFSLSPDPGVEGCGLICSECVAAIRVIMKERHKINEGK